MSQHAKGREEDNDAQFLRAYSSASLLGSNRTVGILLGLEGWVYHRWDRSFSPLLLCQALPGPISSVSVGRLERSFHRRDTCNHLS